MNKIFEIIRTDARHIFTNVISLVVCVGMIVVPSFYAWFNTAASWDPYGNTSNLKIALVNSDEGYKSDLMPVEVNMGERIVSQLRASKSIGYVVTDEDDAKEGVASGTYYAALVIPQDFTRNMLTGLLQQDGSTTKPTVEYYSNQKRNAIADIVTDKASSSVQQTIDESFVKTAVEVGAGTLDQLNQYLDDDKLSGVAQTLDNSLTDATDELRRTSSNVEGYAALVGSVRSLADNADTTLDSALSGVNNSSDALRESATGVRQLDSGLDSAATALQNAIDKGTSSLGDVKNDINDAFDTANGQTDELVDKLGVVKTAVDKQTSALDKLSSDLDGTDTIAKKYEKSLSEGSDNWNYVHQLSITIPGINSRVQSAKERTQTLSDGIQKTIDDLKDAKTDANSAKATLEALADDAANSMGNVQADYAGNLKPSLEQLAKGIDDAADTVDSIQGQLQDTSDSLDSAISSTDKSLDDLQGSLTDAAQKLRGAASDLDALRGKLRAALDSGDIAQVRQILSADTESLAEFISDPIQLDRTAVYPVENNGSAMAPFYTVLSIWIGGVILCALVKTAPSKKRLEAIGAKPYQAYFGRITFFVIIGFLQTLVIIGGDLFFLKIQCLHPWLLLLMALVSSLVFVNIVFSLTASFGDVGKAIAVLLMVIQVAGSGGTFPKEMLPAAFQAVYPFLPFVHAEACMRSAIAGLYGMDYWISLLKLLSFLIPSLILGLLLRKPVIRLNHWFEHQLENTKLM
ncbi:MAG: YhgE/Pip domain-containing protein [Coriobacteriales bacterium]|nr:YhgE/Pip domain-containing protein [Coriobacteriales bacterium]